MLNAFKNKTINTEKLISNTFKIEEANKAYDLLKTNKQILCKFTEIASKRETTIFSNQNPISYLLVKLLFVDF